MRGKKSDKRRELRRKEMEKENVMALDKEKGRRRCRQKNEKKREEEKRWIKEKDNSDKRSVRREKEMER